MSSVKKIFFGLLALLLIAGCEKEVEKDPVEVLADSSSVYGMVNSVSGEQASFAEKGNFDSDSTEEISAGVEYTNEEWGIKFYLFEKEKEKYKISYKTPLLEGSFEDALIKKIKFPNYEYEMLYYNSQNYFLGSGGGEIFSYLIDLSKREIFYAHLVSEDQGTGLYISDNVKDKMLHNFFISNFKRDYPELTILAEDKDLKY